MAVAKKKNILEDYIQVTMQNLRLILLMGDHFYLINSMGASPKVVGYGDLRPRMKKGWTTILNMPHDIGRTVDTRIFREEEESVENYKTHAGEPMMHYVKSGMMYVSKTERKRTQYKHEEK